ncbi:MAG: ribosomal protein S18-alanine N-acetyltransferase [Deltaproteobacteria bacterium]|nr:ribosomal protein S18-alanine N-acetyltransferase [Deltaproteobacteria bacterium]
MAESAGRIDGFGLSWVVTDELHIMKLAVDEGRRRQGIAGRLLDDSIAAGRMRGTNYVLLEVRDTNEEAIRFYEAHGFRHIGIRPGYYAETREDAILMRKDLA